MKVKKISLLSILSIFIVVSGMFKIPNFVTGSEFQLSAPIAVLIACIFGFKMYLISAIVASVISFILGSATILNIIVAMVFRISIGLGVIIFKNKKVGFLFLGPFSSFISRVVLSKILNVNLWTLVVPTIPGMVFTVIFCVLFYDTFYKVVEKSNFKEFIYYKRKE